MVIIGDSQMQRLSPDHFDNLTYNYGSKAEHYFFKSIQIMKTCFSDSSIFIAEKLADLGYLYFEQEKYENALKYFTASHNVLIKHLPINNIACAYSLNNIGDAYCNLGYFSKGISNYLNNSFYGKYLNKNQYYK